MFNFDDLPDFEPLDITLKLLESDNDNSVLLGLEKLRKVFSISFSFDNNNKRIISYNSISRLILMN